MQCATPEKLLAQPKDAFVADFVGADRALKRLALTTAGAAAAPPLPAPGAPVAAASASLREVLSLLLATGADSALVRGDDGSALGGISLSAIRGFALTPGGNDPP